MTRSSHWFCNVLLKTNKFKSYLDKWNNKISTNQTWELFKLRFCKAAKILRKFLTATSQQVGFTNQAVQEISNNVSNMINANTQDTSGADSFMQERSTAVAENQQLLPQLLQSLNMMSSAITNLQADRVTTRRCRCC